MTFPISGGEYRINPTTGAREQTDPPTDHRPHPAPHPAPHEPAGAGHAEPQPQESTP